MARPPRDAFVTARTAGAPVPVDEQLRAHARSIFDAAIAAVDPGPLVARALARPGFLGPARRVHILAAGKAAVPMARAALDAIGSRAARTLVVAPHADVPTSLIDSMVVGAGHPLPDEGSIAVGHAAMRMLSSMAQDDVVLVLLSGGASALLASPADGITLDDYRTATALLLASGASIGEINCVRAHIDTLKGGGLARASAPAAVTGLLISDVVGNDPQVIASGPLSGVSSTFRDALDILERYNLTAAIPERVRRHLDAGEAGRVPGPARPGDPVLERVRLEIIADNAMALDAAAARATALGYAVTRRTEPLTGEAADAGLILGGWLTETARTPVDTCLIAGGETTVTLHNGYGRENLGGRNQELALAAATAIAGHTGSVLLAGGTDGIDGPTTAAGGLVDGASVARMRQAKIDPADALARHDAHEALRLSGDLLVTGATGTNVMDVVIALRRSSPPG